MNPHLHSRAWAGRRLLALACVLALALPALVGPALAAARPAADQNVQVENFLEKTRFVLHIGAAYFAFHRWIYKPYKEGKFKSGADGRTKALVKAGIAAAFVAREVKVSVDLAKKDKTLRKLGVPVTALAAAVTGMVAKLKSGGLPDLDAIETTIKGLSGKASGLGLNLKDRSVPIPGL